MSDITWEDPPPQGYGPGSPTRFLAEADAMRANPGKWVKLKQYASPNSATSSGTSIRKGKFRAFPAGEFDVVVRRTAVYVRYIGGDE